VAVDGRKKGETVMNTKHISLVGSILVAGLGCATLPRAGVTSAGDPGERRVAIASGPALVHISTAGSGTASLYLTDDAGNGSSTCPSQEAEGVVPFKALEDDDYVGDLAVPKGKRVCAVVDSPVLIVDWLTEDYASPDHADRSVPVAPPTAPDAPGVLLAKK
jgi:hypothetical protein